MHPHHGFQLHGKENSLDLLCSASNTRPARMPLRFPVMECCGTDPTDIQNDFPSHGHRASHSRGSDQRYRHRHHLPHPLPLKYEYGNLASARLLRENMPLQVLQVHFLQCMHFCHRHLPVSLAGQMPHSFHWCNKCLCCFFHIFRAPCCGNQLPVLRLQSFLLSAYLIYWLHRQVQLLRLQLLRFQVLIFYCYLTL